MTVEQGSIMDQYGDISTVALYPIYPVKIEIRKISDPNSLLPTMYRGMVYRVEYSSRGIPYPFVMDVLECRSKAAILHKFDIYTNRVAKLDMTTIQPDLF